MNLGWVRVSVEHMFVFELLDAETADTAGSFTTAVPGPWRIGDTFLMTDGRRLRIVDQLNAQPTDPRCAGVWLVEPAVGTI